jgi:hypothetical protein
MKAESFLKKGYRIKLLTIPVLILLVLTAIPSLAGEKTDTMEALKGALKADKKAFIEQYMQLTQAEAKEFWPYYNSYQFDLQKINDRLIKLIDDYAKNYKNLSDQDATKMVDEYLSIERDQLKLKELYFRTLRKTLPVKKVARFLQLENKINAIVRFELAANIPMVK